MNAVPGSPIPPGRSADTVSSEAAEALARLVAEEGETLRRMLVGVTRDHATAQDVLQFAVTQFLTHGAPIPADGRRAWLYRVAVNEALRLRRRAKTDQHFQQRTQAGQSDRTDPADLPTAGLLRAERVERVRQAVADLPPPERTIIELRTYRDLTFREIADQTGQPLGTVLWRMRQAIARLRQTLADEPLDDA